MFDTLPRNTQAIKDWTWANFEPYYADLQNRDLDADSAPAWLADWSRLVHLMTEWFARSRLASNQNTGDEQAEAYYKHLLADIYPSMTQADNDLSLKLLHSGIQPEGFDIPLRNLRADTELFREENLPLLTREQALGMEYGKITGAQTIEWAGEEYTVPQVEKLLEHPDRATREHIWRLSMDRRLKDRDALNGVWTQLFNVRRKVALNAGYDNYRDFRWKQLQRFDYSPKDCETFHAAIEKVVVPAAQRANERRRARLGVDQLRPWDLNVDPLGREPLRPWTDVEDFAQRAETIFGHVDPQLGEYYAIMRHEGLLDLPNRKNKRPGAFCTRFPVSRRPFIFMNAVGVQGDVRTLLHEAGHAFHTFECFNLDYAEQQNYPIEFGEVASMAMELLAAPYLTREAGGYFSESDAARDRVQHLEKILLFWPYMAVVDSFQHWAYTDGIAAADPTNCDAAWSALWDRFMKVDFSGMDDIKAAGWQRKQHIYLYPFYYVEYGLAQLGAVQVWANALDDQPGAVAAYRRALALGGTRSIPDLYVAAGVKFAFDADTLSRAIDLIEDTIESLEERA